MQNYKAIIEADFPELEIGEVKIHDDSWDNVAVEVNGEYIFRFPEKKEGTENPFAVEVRALKYLQDKITLPIPNPTFTGKTVPYMGYRKIPGERLSTELYDSLTKAGKQRLVSDLANFLWEIHQSMTPEEAQAMDVKTEHPLIFVQQILSVLLQQITDETLLDFIQNTAAEFEEVVQQKSIAVFLHNDLHETNMAFDPVARKLNGIFDFGDIATGDIHSDFNPLYSFNRDLLERVVLRYQELSGRTLSLRRIVLYDRINSLSDLAEVIDKPESEVYQHVLRRIAHWKKELGIYT